MARKPEMAHSRTYEDFYKFLGTRPELMGVMARMNMNNTASFLTDGLMNVYNNKSKVSKFQPINALEVQWEIEVGFMKRIPFVAKPSEDGAGGSDIKMHFGERYYERYDTFIIEESGQQCIVKSVPQRKADNYWEYIVQLISSDYEAILDSDACEIGMQTRFLSNTMPEYHSEGYTKGMSNAEKHRTWIKESRVDISMSSRYDAMEEQFMKISQADGTGEMKEKFFKLNKMEKDLMDSWWTVKNQALLWDKSTMDANGKCTVFDHQNRPLIQGDGLIPQYERFAGKMKYTNLNISVFDTVIDQMTEKSDEATGNHYMFVINRVLWSQIQKSLREWIKDWNSIPTLMYSKHTGTMVKADNPVKVGATFTSYEVAGNTITFVVDNAVSKAYPTKGWGICMDMSPNMTSGDPAVAGFTVKGKELISNKYTGVGFKDGEVATAVAGGKLILSGYYGIAAFAPYKAFILSQN